MMTRVNLTAFVAVLLLATAACSAGGSRYHTGPTTTEAPERSDATSSSDEAAEFLAHAAAEMKRWDQSEHRYITGGRVSGDYLIVEAQLRRDDESEAEILCNILLAHSYDRTWTWTRIDIQPVDGGVAARCEQFTP